MSRAYRSDPIKVQSNANAVIFDGAWIWYSVPVAVQNNGKTYIAYVAGERNTGDIGIASIDHETEAVSTTILRDSFDYDDHANPTILIRNSDDKIVPFYTNHTGNTFLRWKISDSANDISSFGAENTVSSSVASSFITYPQPVQVPDENNEIFVFYRTVSGDQNRQWTYRRSSDGGDTFGSEHILRENFSDWTGGIVNPYTIPKGDGGGRIHFCSTDYEQVGEGGTPSNIYHFYYKNGSYYQSDGTKIKDEADLPITTATEVTTVDNSDNVTIWDIAINNDGNPVITYVYWQDFATSHIYRYAKWTGSQWETHDILDSGGPISERDSGKWYSGGVRLNQTDPSIVYVSEQITDNIYTIKKYSTEDGGQSWSEEQNYLNLPNSKNIRPRYPRNADESVVEVLWLSRRYTNLRDYDMRVVRGTE